VANKSILKCPSPYRGKTQCIDVGLVPDIDERGAVIGINSLAHDLTGKRQVQVE